MPTKTPLYPPVYFDTTLLYLNLWAIILAQLKNNESTPWNWNWNYIPTLNKLCSTLLSYYFFILQPVKLFLLFQCNFAVNRCSLNSTKFVRSSPSYCAISLQLFLIFPQLTTKVNISSVISYHCRSNERNGTSLAKGQNYFFYIFYYHSPSNNG